MSDFITVAAVDDIEPGYAIVVEVDGRGIALARLADGSFRAIDDLCTHDGGPLGEGEVIDGRIECPRHGAHFDLTTGRAVTLPAVVGVKAYEVRVEGDSVQVRFGD
ncbi:MAG: Rieske 2Fe-2S domain-containing protein [Dehalococcoidia bacterium]|nr:Rieske 2Fe-2S domain-containing protein [Dehalococcoidia bacterium]